MLVRYLLHLRQLSKGAQDRHAFFVATSVTVALLLIWVVTLPGRLEPVTTATETEHTPRPLTSLLLRTRDHLAAVLGTRATTTPETAAGASTTLPSTPTIVTELELTPEDVAKAQAAAAVPYSPAPTTTPRAIRIATTTTATTGTTTASTTR